MAENYYTAGVFSIHIQEIKPNGDIVKRMIMLNPSEGKEHMSKDELLKQLTRCVCDPEFISSEDLHIIAKEAMYYILEEKSHEGIDHYNTVLTWDDYIHDILPG